MTALSTDPIIVIVGPTASGKTELAQRLALILHGEVVSADSMQVYRGMDIGTGKLPVEDRRVPHFGFDLIDPGEPFSAALYQTYARNCFHDITQRGKRIVLVGGTGLYIRAAIDEFQFPKGEQVNNPIRAEAMAFAEAEGADALWERLYRCDPESAAVVHPHNVRRVARALEMLAEGERYAVQKKRLDRIPQHYDAVFIGLEVTPAVLNSRIDRRVGRMVAAGLVDEVKSLLRQGFRSGITAPQAIGYKEIVNALDGEMGLDEAIDHIKRATHRYGKRQRTWFRRDRRIHWVNADDGDEKRITQEAFSLLR